MLSVNHPDAVHDARSVMIANSQLPLPDRKD